MIQIKASFTFYSDQTWYQHHWRKQKHNPDSLKLRKLFRWRVHAVINTPAGEWWQSLRGECGPMMVLTWPPGSQRSPRSPRSPAPGVSTVQSLKNVTNILHQPSRPDPVSVFHLSGGVRALWSNHLKSIRVHSRGSQSEGRGPRGSIMTFKPVMWRSNSYFFEWVWFKTGAQVFRSCCCLAVCLTPPSTCAGARSGSGVVVHAEL